MAINVIGQVFNGTTGQDNLGPGFGNDRYIMTADNFITDTIDGGSGRDTVDYSPSTVGVKITLRDSPTKIGATGGTVEADFPMQFFNPSTGKFFQFEHHQVVANLKNIENATGSNFNDVLIGNSQDNVLTGLGGRDVMTGGGGNDTFVFRDASDSPGFSAQTMDSITDFAHGVDHVDLRGLANETVGNVPLSFTDGPLTGVPGQLVAAFTGPQGFLIGADLDGDRDLDFSFMMKLTDDHVRPTESDFILV